MASNAAMIFVLAQEPGGLGVDGECRNSCHSNCPGQPHCLHLKVNSTVSTCSYSILFIYECGRKPRYPGFWKKVAGKTMFISPKRWSHIHCHILIYVQQYLNIHPRWVVSNLGPPCSIPWFLTTLLSRNQTWLAGKKTLGSMMFPLMFPFK